MHLQNLLAKVVWQAGACRDWATVPLCNSKLFIDGHCPILVLTTVLGHPRRAGAKK
jgi:hypothetical protein